MPKTVLTATDIDKLAGRVCAENGIKNLPSIEDIDLCMKSWMEKFSARMNKHELALAFEMNINGDLSKKVEHYQCFSREYFCNVVLLYLEQKEAALRKAVHTETKKETAPEIDFKKLNSELLQAIESDRELVKAGWPIGLNFALKTKFDVVAKGKEISEDMVRDARAKAVQDVCSQIRQERERARVNKKDGTYLELGHQLVRIKDNKLLTESDETQLQYTAMLFLYHELLTSK